MPRSNGLGISWFWKRRQLRFDSGPGQSSWGVDCGQCRNSQHSKNCLSSCRKTEVKKIINVSYLNNGESSVFCISLHLYICIVTIQCVYIHIHTQDLVLNNLKRLIYHKQNQPIPSKLRNSSLLPIVDPHRCYYSGLVDLGVMLMKSTPHFPNSTTGTSPSDAVSPPLRLILCCILCVWRG